MSEKKYPSEISDVNSTIRLGIVYIKPSVFVLGGTCYEFA